MKLRVLFIEDMPDDTTLMLRRLREGGIEPQWARVDTAAALREALAGEQWQVALVDFNLPSFSGPEALAILAELAPGIAAITVSGAITEETAVATITAGAVDYVLKDNLTRLAPAVLRAVAGAELRRKERQASQQARQTVYAIEHSSQVIVYVSEDGTILYVNEAARSFGGASPTEAVGEKIWGWSPVVDEQRWAELWRAAAQHTIVDFETIVRRAGGEERLISATFDYFERDADSFVIVYARDITAQRAAEERAEESEARYARLADNAPDIIFRYDFLPTMGLTYINAAVETITGYSPEECYADPQLMLTMVHPDDAAQMAAMMQSLSPPEGPMLMRWIGKDGVTRWMESSIVPVRDAGGRLLTVEGITRDVTERKLAQETLRRSEDRFRHVSEATSDFAYTCVRRPGGPFAFEWLSGAVERSTGWSRAELLERGCWKALVVDEDVPLFEEQVSGLAAGDSGVCELRIRDKQGDVRWLAVYSEAEQDAQDPAVHRLHGACQDITERKQAEQELRFTRFVVERAGDLVLWMTAQGAIMYANRSTCETLGYGFDELCAMTIHDIDPVLSPERWPKHIEELEWAGSLTFETPYRAKNGTVISMEVTAMYLEYYGDTYVVAFARDITARKLAEKALRESEARLGEAQRIGQMGSWEWDFVADTARWSDEMFRLLGLDPDTHDGTPEAILRVVHPDDREYVARNMWDDLSHDAGPPLEYRVIRSDGEERIVRVTGRIVFDEAGRPVKNVGVMQDITESQLAEEALRESEERFEQFADHFPGYLFMQDEALRYVYVNRREDAEGDVRRRDWIGKKPSEVWEGDFAAKEDVRVQRALDGEVVDIVAPWMPRGLHEYLHSIYFPIPRAGRPSLAGGISIDVTEQFEAQQEVLRQADQLRRTVDGAVLALSLVVETRDPYTAGHERRVSELATAIAVDMGVAGEQLSALRLGGLIHDIGKVAVPAEILSKPGRLSAVEFDLIKQHPQSGFDILGAIDFGLPVAEMVLQHHERLDGSGYPRGLAGEEIITEAKILAVADVVEAMSSHRPYRAALGMEAALAEISAHAGVRYDAAVVATCVRLVEAQGFAFTL